MLPPLHQGGGSSLQDIGAVCVSDRHSQVIQQQKQTIKELRKKMTAMKEANPPSELWAMYIHTYIHMEAVSILSACIISYICTYILTIVFKTTTLQCFSTTTLLCSPRPAISAAQDAGAKLQAPHTAGQPRAAGQHCCGPEPSWDRGADTDPWSSRPTLSTGLRGHAECTGVQ